MGSGAAGIRTGYHMGSWCIQGKGLATRLLHQSQLTYLSIPPGMDSTVLVRGMNEVFFLKAYLFSFQSQICKEEERQRGRSSIC